jgi:hypothetical protein
VRIEGGADQEMQQEAAIRVIIHNLLTPLVLRDLSERPLPVPDSSPEAVQNGV